MLDKRGVSCSTPMEENSAKKKGRNSLQRKFPLPNGTAAVALLEGGVIIYVECRRMFILYFGSFMQAAKKKKEKKIHFS